MSNRSIQEIHAESLALAAGVISAPQLAVSHARWYPKPPRRRIRRLCQWLLLRLSRSSREAADWLERGMYSGSVAS